MTIDHEATELEPGADIRELSLYMAEHPDVDLTECDGRDVNAIGAKLPRGKFVNADLQGALLCHCNLRDADFSGANLAGANLHGSDLTGAKFTDTWLEDIVWDNVIGKPKEADDFLPHEPDFPEEP